MKTVPYTEVKFQAQGMDLRDYFAAAALQGILASPNVPMIRPIAEQAYDIADFMMKTREK